MEGYFSPQRRRDSAEFYRDFRKGFFSLLFLCADSAIPLRLCGESI